MTIPFHSTLKRLTVTVIAAALGIGLFATGVWAGSDGNRGDRAQAVQPVGFFWRYHARTGSPTGPGGQPDFWNYHPTTGEKNSDTSPGVAPDELAALWTGQP
jgi:hypothetical protein